MIKKTNLQFIFLLGILILFASCNGQNNYRNTSTDKMPVQLGKVVSELDPTIWDIYQDKKTNYWFGSKENGVYCYDGKKMIHYSVEDGLVSDHIRGIQEDDLGNLYFETSHGVSKFNGQNFKTLKIKNENSPSTDWKLDTNDLWFRIGFDKEGPYRYDGNYLYYLKFPKSPQEDSFYIQNPMVSYSPYGIYELYQDKTGAVWFGTSGLGLCRYDGDLISWHYEDQLQTTPGGGDFGTRAIFQDKDDYFWVNNSRYRYKALPTNTNHLNFKKENGLGYLNNDGVIEFPFFLSITQDNDGNLWMVTYEDGVWKNNGKELIQYPVNDGRTGVLLFSAYKDNQGVIWLGSHNAGAYKFNGESFEKFEF